ncbi:inter-alpha-trypsin inhibitor heavy chain H4-like isoform X2 [Homalodisca vitripennis]|uniref:inter-alpha-trypsin inhibitor heavy chain H4-like isoform X2 n=1 Tax=Homalodisca vitripennis TaxID=197043 RepID=UPI001EE9B435|nr:inter-alpha-trypsin inhibitor heavy chain H4-like isoform X2 [Homalodisca vitripennis]
MHMNILRSLNVCALLLLLQAHLSTQDMVSYVTRSRRSVAGDSHVKVKPIIRSLHITSDIKYRYATTLVSSRVVNPSDQAGEAVFYVTLPESAFISEFLMEVKDEVYKAHVKKKDEAKTEYDEAVQAGQSAGHVVLDVRDSNQFSVSVNIEAHGKVTFNLTYEQLLSRNLGVYTNTININPQQIVGDMSVTVNIEEPTTINYLEVIGLDVSSGSIVNKRNVLALIEEKSPNHKSVVWSPTPEEQRSGDIDGLSCQFVVKYDVDRKGKEQQIILVHEGYFVHFFAPENLPPLRKHVVFVLDYSNSMRGRKREQLEDAMFKILFDLDYKDYFSIIVFHDHTEAWSPTSIYSSAPWDNAQHVLDGSFVIEATPTNIVAAHSYLKQYTYLRSTNIMAALKTGLQLASIGSDLWEKESGPPQPVIVFLTDGQPTTGVRIPDTIISDTKTLNTNEIQIFCLAFGEDADFDFLKKLSLTNHAFARKIYEAADASDQLNNFYKTISSPLLSNITFTYTPDQVDYSSRTKVDFLVFFNGSEIVVAGKINNQIKAKETIGELSGLTANGPEKYPIVIDVMSIISVTRSTKNVGHLEKMWAYLNIQQLLDEANSLDQRDEIAKIKEKALKLALQYSFVTPLTSLVVVKPNETESAVDTIPVSLAQKMWQRWQVPTTPSYPSQPAQKWQRWQVPTTPSYPSQPDRDRVPRWPLPVLYVEDYSSTVPPPRWPPAPESGRYIHPVWGQPYWPENDIIRKISLDDIKWLHPLSTNLTRVPVKGRVFILGLNQTDLSFGTCSVMGLVGDCHHIQYCALDILQYGVEYFLPLQCTIPGDFLGVCCPQGIA